jgi:hypothetical protein
MADAPVPTRPGGGGLAWLKTRQGRLVAGGAAALGIVVLALARKRNAGAGGFTATEPQGGSDATLQDRLDQLTGTGGTLDEQGAAISGLAGAVEHLTDLVESRDPANSPSSSTPPASTIVGKVGHLAGSSNRSDVSFRWAPVQGAVKYVVELIQGKDQVIRKTVVTDPYFRAGGGLQAGKPYRVRVTPVGASGKTGGVASSTYRTKS